MKIGVVADTHVPKRAKNLPKKLLSGLKGVDLIIHAGDWVSVDVVNTLSSIAPLKGVVGNNDGAEIEKLFPKKQILTINGYKIGIVHGDGVKKTTVARAREAFIDDDVDMIIFGHSHKPYYEVVDGVVMFNPGSPTDKRRQPKYSYGIIELSNKIKAKHHYFIDRT